MKVELLRGVVLAPGEHGVIGQVLDMEPARVRHFLQRGIVRVLPIETPEPPVVHRDPTPQTIDPASRRKR